MRGRRLTALPGRWQEPGSREWLGHGRPQVQARVTVMPAADREDTRSNETDGVPGLGSTPPSCFPIHTDDPCSRSRTAHPQHRQAAHSLGGRQRRYPLHDAEMETASFSKVMYTGRFCVCFFPSTEQKEVVTQCSHRNQAPVRGIGPVLFPSLLRWKFRNVKEAPG